MSTALRLKKKRRVPSTSGVTVGGKYLVAYN